jgi:histidinol phosphatase-like enzyme
MKIQETKVIHFTEDNLIEEHKSLSIDFVQEWHFNINTIQEENMLSKAELVIYTNNKGVSKILVSRYFSI